MRPRRKPGQIGRGHAQQIGHGTVAARLQAVTRGTEIKIQRLTRVDVLGRGGRCKDRKRYAQDLAKHMGADLGKGAGAHGGSSGTRHP